jgi:hypothetical protein
LWAKSLCTSRAFSLPIPPEDEFEKSVINSYYPDSKITALLPFIHFFNHSFKAQCETPVLLTDQDGTQKIIVKSLVPISKGEEIFILYGGMNNKELMLNYGFFVPGNPYDSFLREDGSIVRRGAQRPTHADTKVDGPILSLPQRYLADKKSFINSN